MNTVETESFSNISINNNNDTSNNNNNNDNINFNDDTSDDIRIVDDSKETINSSHERSITIHIPKIENSVNTNIEINGNEPAAAFINQTQSKETEMDNNYIMNEKKKRDKMKSKSSSPEYARLIPSKVDTILDDSNNKPIFKLTFSDVDTTPRQSGGKTPMQSIKQHSLQAPSSAPEPLTLHYLESERLKKSKTTLTRRYDYLSTGLDSKRSSRDTNEYTVMLPGLKDRNKIIERRKTIRKTIKSSRGLLSINAPVEHVDRSNNFIFAVADEDTLTKIGLQVTDFESPSKEKNIVVALSDALQSPILLNKNLIGDRVKSKKGRIIRSLSCKTKSEDLKTVTTPVPKDKDVSEEDYNPRTVVTEPTGPSPASYHVPRKPLNEKTSPSYTFGTRCFVEKKGGGRTSWEKEWFSSKEPFTIKTDFKRDRKWPNPNDHTNKPGIGDRTQLTWYQYPTYTMGYKLNNEKPVQQPVKPTPTTSTVSFDVNENQIILKTNPRAEYNLRDSKDNTKPKITLKSRVKGTVLWQKPENTPGPIYDHTKFSSVSPTRPKFSISQSMAVNKNGYKAGPYAVL